VPRIALRILMPVGQGKLLGIEWTADATATTIEDVDVDHRCANITMAEQFLHRADIIAILNQCVAKEWRSVWQLPCLAIPA
jgi:hypothetical protein